MKPISVIITEYWPRNFLKYAVKSVLNQTLDRGLYELIVVKKFRDPDVDYLIESNGGKVVILDDKPIGYYLYAGIVESEGEVLAFLDDDDAFTFRKLEYVYKYVYGKGDVCYYHHLAYIIDKHNKLLGKSFGGPSETIVINSRDKKQVKHVLNKYGLIGSLMSATVVRKEAVVERLNQLRTLITGQDSFMFLASLNSNCLLIHEPLNLSFYRVHGWQASLPWGSAPREVLVRFARQAVLNQHGFYQLKKAFPIVENLPLRHHPLGGYHYNVLGLIALGLNKELVASTGFLALWRGLFDKSIYRVLAGSLGIVYGFLPRKVTQQLLLKYYMGRLTYGK